MEIYYKTHASRKREAAFFDAVRKQYPDSKHKDQIYYILDHHPELTSASISIAEVIDLVSNSTEFDLAVKEKLLGQLTKLPDAIKIAIEGTKISCNVVFANDGKPYFIEFNEEQHRELTVDRLSTIYDLSDNAIEVPRYVQRLIRDVWRIKYLKNITLIWSDWFETFNKVPNLEEGFNEYSLPKRFSFKNLGVR